MFYLFVENVDNILQKMFQYIEMLRKEGNMEWVFKECQQLAYINFKYMDNKKPFVWTVTLARRMQVIHLNRAVYKNSSNHDQIIKYVHFL